MSDSVVLSRSPCCGVLCPLYGCAQLEWNAAWSGARRPAVTMPAPVPGSGWEGGCFQKKSVALLRARCALPPPGAAQHGPVIAQHAGHKLTTHFQLSCAGNLCESSVVPVARVGQCRILLTVFRRDGAPSPCPLLAQLIRPAIYIHKLTTPHKNTETARSCAEGVQRAWGTMSGQTLESLCRDCAAKYQKFAKQVCGVRGGETGTRDGGVAAVYEGVGFPHPRGTNHQGTSPCCPLHAARRARPRERSTTVLHGTPSSRGSWTNSARPGAAASPASGGSSCSTSSMDIMAQPAVLSSSCSNSSQRCCGRCLCSARPSCGRTAWRRAAGWRRLPAWRAAGCSRARS